jgi:glycosyltransferase involved in cell wall biosynthesis
MPQHRDFMRIAIFDYRVIARNPAGSCHLTLLRALRHEHVFTVFAVEFDNPDPERIEWVHVRVPRRPLALLFVSFHVAAPILYLWHRLRTGKAFDLIQSVESNLGFGELLYAHFSHTRYLKSGHPGFSGLRGWMRWIDHALHAGVERFRFRSAKRIVVPSRGLQQEIQADFHLADKKIEVIANPISVQTFARPESFDGESFRQSLDLKLSDVVCVFCALGHFERKGLPLLLEALCSPALNSIKLVVVGGEPDLIRTYKSRASRLQVDLQMRFVGFQHDARPYLWSADAFILPSAYETFSLAAYEAAAAGLPIIAPRLNGICDLLADGVTGFVIHPSTASITGALGRLLQTPPAERAEIGALAKAAASSYSIERFTESWRSLYQHWPSRAGRIAATSSRRSSMGRVEPV